MKKLFQILVEVTFDALFTFAYFIKTNLVNFANTANFILPYMMFFIGQHMALERNRVVAGGELFIPIVFAILIYYLRSTANKLGTGITIPIPNKRFTKVSKDGEVSIEHKQIQELLLYVADLEDWLERKGML